MGRRKRYSYESVREIMNDSEQMLNEYCSNPPSPEEYRMVHGVSCILGCCTAILLTDEEIMELEKRIVNLKLRRAQYENDLTSFIAKTNFRKEDDK